MAHRALNGHWLWLVVRATERKKKKKRERERERERGVSGLTGNRGCGCLGGSARLCPETCGAQAPGVHATIQEVPERAGQEE